jgi:hypothetical protein
VGIVVAGGGALLFLGTCGTMALRFALSPDGKNVRAGIVALQSAGCHAVKINVMQGMGRLPGFPNLPDGGEPPAVLSGRISLKCGVAPGPSPPTCDAVARAYLAVVEANTRPLFVTVHVDGNGVDRCSALYGPDGTPQEWP